MQVLTTKPARTLRIHQPQRPRPRHHRPKQRQHHIEYLLATYDTSNSLSYTSSPNKFLTQSWLHFQTSGQGPYFGQRAWFTFYAEEKPASVLDRYGAEIWRVTGVIEAALKKNGDWLVGDKCSYADLAFVPWYWLCPAIMGEGFDKVSFYSSEFPGRRRLVVEVKERDVLTVLSLLGMGVQVPD
jgi:glutathione S-transferase